MAVWEGERPREPKRLGEMELARTLALPGVPDSLTFVDFSASRLFTGWPMIAGRTAKLLTAATLALLMLLCDAASRCAGAATPRQQSLDEWRSLTAPTAAVPRVFVKGNQIRFYFQTATNVEEFSAHWEPAPCPE